MSTPAIDRPSIALAKALDNMMVETGEDDDDLALYLTCQTCGEQVCTVEHSDTMRVLFNTALAHVCKS